MVKKEEEHTTYEVGPISESRMRAIMEELWQDDGVGREALREELKEYPYGASGLEYDLLFAREGYTPHYVENVIDPVDGEEKLVMFDPWTRHSATIYNPKTREIEWEFVLPVGPLPAPHQGGMLLTTISGFGNAGDIFATDRSNNIIVIDRATRQIMYSRAYAGTQQLLDGIIIGIDNASVIVSDYHYLLGFVAKLGLPNLNTIWSTNIIFASKLSVIKGAGVSGHSPSFGGEYLAVSNWQMAGPVPPQERRAGPIYELRDSDGAIMWRNPDVNEVGTPVAAPHSAFRMGRVELRGNITVVGSEAGGGIFGIDYYGRCTFGFSPAGYFYYGVGTRRYKFNPYLLGEVTHVFPLLNGRIGFTSWNGVNRVTVGEIRRFPEKQQVSYSLALAYASQNAMVWLDPGIPVVEWDETLIVIKNTGGNSLDYAVDAYVVSMVDTVNEINYGRVANVFSGPIAAGADVEIDSIHPFTWLRIGIKSTTPGSPTTYDVYITQRK